MANELTLKQFQNWRAYHLLNPLPQTAAKYYHAWQCCLIAANGGAKTKPQDWWPDWGKQYTGHGIRRQSMAEMRQSMMAASRIADE